LDEKRGSITSPFSLNRYALNKGDGVNYIDINGYERGAIGWTWSDAGHLILDGVGLIPIVGEPADFVNAIWYESEGDHINSALSTAGMVPLLGWGATGAKVGLKVGKKTVKHTLINPNTIKFTQDSIGKEFKNGQKLEDITKGLKTGKISPDDFPPIRVFEKNGKKFTLDNRRLKVFQDAGIKIPTVKATAKEIKDEAFKFTSKNGGDSIRIRGE
jgi:hypothetical protein